MVPLSEETTGAPRGPTVPMTATPVAASNSPPNAGAAPAPSPVTPLRRATYVRVADLVRAFDIDPDNLRKEMARAEAAAAERSEAGSGKGEEGGGSRVLADQENVNPAVDRGGDRAAAGGGGDGPGKQDDPSAAIALSGLSLEEKGAAPEERQGPQKPYQQRLVPPSGGSNLCLLVGKVDVVVDKLRVDRSRVRLAEVEVGDETGSVSLRARDDQIDALKEISDRSGAVVLRNCTMELYQGRHLRLAVTKWGKLSPYPDQIPSTPAPPSKINRELNYSSVDLNLVVGEMQPQSNEDSSTSSSGGRHRLMTPTTTGSQQGQGRDVGLDEGPPRGPGAQQPHGGTPKQKRKGRDKKPQGQYRPGQPTHLLQPQPGGGPAAFLPYMMPAIGSFPPVYPPGANVAPYGYHPVPPHLQERAEAPGQGRHQHHPHHPMGPPQHQHQHQQHRADHHQKQQQHLLLQQFELQQRHLEQMQLFQQQQERHRRMFEQPPPPPPPPPPPHGHGHGQHQGGQHQHQHQAIHQAPSPVFIQDLLRAGGVEGGGGGGAGGSGQAAVILPPMAGGGGDPRDYAHSSPPHGPRPGVPLRQRGGPAPPGGEGGRQGGEDSKSGGMRGGPGERGGRGGGGGATHLYEERFSQGHAMGPWHEPRRSAGGGGAMSSVPGMETPPPSPGRMNPQAAAFAPSQGKVQGPMLPSHHQQVPQSPQYPYVPYESLQVGAAAGGGMYGSPLGHHQPHGLFPAQGGLYMPGFRSVDEDAVQGPAHTPGDLRYEAAGAGGAEVQGRGGDQATGGGKGRRDAKGAGSHRGEAPKRGDGMDK